MIEGAVSEQDIVAPEPHLDLAQRLLQKVVTWRGAERGEPLANLYKECRDIAGVGGRHLMPAHLLLVPQLDTGSLQTALGRLNGLGRGANVMFRVKPQGRFDAALVPIGPTGELPDRWLLAVEDTLVPADAVALFGHALGHLLLNREAGRMGQQPPLDPRDGRTHADTLAELRQLEATRQPINRRVLETYPQLEALLQPPEELVFPTTLAPGFRERLAGWGWRGQYVTAPYDFTDGRIYVSGAAIRRGPKLRVDALLRAAPSLPIALAQSRRSGETLENATARLIEYAHDRLYLPFAYLLDEDGTIHEFDWTAGDNVHVSTSDAIPGRDELLHRWLEALGLNDEKARVAVSYPYHLGSGWRPRYYQDVAINRTVIAVLQAKRQLRAPRVLLTMATGTGKTPVAFQLVWKLKRAHAIGNVLFLTDRDYLLGQAMDNHFAPFGQACHRVKGSLGTAWDLLFATYQALAGDAERPGLYQQYPHNFFDLVIVDEAHRGSAGDESNWRGILEHFDTAIQIGLTATPLSNDNVQTYEYFGRPVTTYSLRLGINDGFLAPYRVRRVRLTNALDAEPILEGPAPSTELEPLSLDDLDLTETAATLVAATDTIARHLARYLRDIDPMAKTIVFCVDQAHALQMREALKDELSDLVARYADYVERIVSDEGTEGKLALGRFSTPDESCPVIVTTSRLLSTGVDVPTCKNIVLARPVGSMVEFKQIIGRGTRLYEPQKTWFTIVDYAGATKHFFDPEFDGDPEVVDVEDLFPQPQPEAEHDDPESGGETQVPHVDGTYNIPEEDEPSPLGTQELPEGYDPDHGGGSASDVPTDGQQATSTGTYDQRGPEQDHTPETNDGKQPSAEHDPVSTGTTNEPVITDGVKTRTGAVEIGAPVPGKNGPQDIPTDPETRTRSGNGRTIAVVGEYVYELSPDGKTLRPFASYPDYAREALAPLQGDSDRVRTRWLQPEQREEITGRLNDAGVDLRELASTLHRPDADPLSLVLHLVDSSPVRSRDEMVERFRERHADFLASYDPKARAILETILDKYVSGNVQDAKDVNDTELLRVPPLSNQGTFMELLQPFGDGQKLRNALREMQILLYTP